MIARKSLRMDSMPSLSEGLGSAAVSSTGSVLADGFSDEVGALAVDRLGFLRNDFAASSSTLSPASLSCGSSLSGVSTSMSSPFAAAAAADASPFVPFVFSAFSADSSPLVAAFGAGGAAFLARRAMALGNEIGKRSVARPSLRFSEPG